MTAEEQIEVIRSVSKEIRKTKESARKFLTDAGIIPAVDLSKDAKKKKRN